MPYINDAQTLADIVSPAAAATQMGIQNDTANQQAQVELQKAQGQLPAQIAQPGLANALTQAQTQAEQGIAQQQQSRGLIDMFATPSGAQAQVSGNQLKITQDQISKMNTLGQYAGQAASLMENIPAPARPAAMQQLLQQNRIDPNTLGPLANGDPDQLRQFSQKVIQGSAQYQQSVGEINAKGVQQQINTQLENQGRLANTEALVGGRTQVANINSQTKLMLQKTDNIIASLTAKQAAGTLTQQEAMTLNQARQAQQLVKTNPFINNMLQDQSQGTPNQMPQATAGPNSAPTTQAPAAVPNAVEAEMRRRGLIQ